MRAQEVFKHIDEDCGGTIDTDEFTQWWMEQQRMKAFTGKGGQLFNMFEASAMMSTLARLSGRSDDGADGVMTGDLEAIASGTLLPKKVRIHVCGRVAQEGDGLVGEQERMIHVRGVGGEHDRLLTIFLAGLRFHSVIRCPAARAARIVRRL